MTRLRSSTRIDSCVCVQHIRERGQHILGVSNTLGCVAYTRGGVSNTRKEGDLGLLDDQVAVLDLV